MARPNHVPKFGNWDANDHVPYTAVFESARAGKVGKMINPNDPSENPGAYGGGIMEEDHPPFQPYAGKIKNSIQPAPRDSFQHNGAEHMGSFHPVDGEKWPTREDGESRRQTVPPSRKMSGESPGHRLQGEIRYPGQQGGLPKTVAGDAPRSRPGLRENGSSGHGSGETQGADRSPSHAQAYQGRLGKKPGASSPAWERKVAAEGGTMFAPATPGRSRLGTKADETPDRGSALPKFGAWDEKDPSSAEGFTVIFNHARHEKKAGGPVRIPGLQTESPARMDYPDLHKQQLSTARHSQPSFWRCCFSSSAME